MYAWAYVQTRKQSSQMPCVTSTYSNCTTASVKNPKHFSRKCSAWGPCICCAAPLKGAACHGNGVPFIPVLPHALYRCLQVLTPAINTMQQWHTLWPVLLFWLLPLTLLDRVSNLRQTCSMWGTGLNEVNKECVKTLVHAPMHCYRYLRRWTHLCTSQESGRSAIHDIYLSASHCCVKFTSLFPVICDMWWFKLRLCDWYSTAVCPYDLYYLQNWSDQYCTAIISGVYYICIGQRHNSEQCIYSTVPPYNRPAIACDIVIPLAITEPISHQTKKHHPLL